MGRVGKPVHPGGHDAAMSTLHATEGMCFYAAARAAHRVLSCASSAPARDDDVVYCACGVGHRPKRSCPRSGRGRASPSRRPHHDRCVTARAVVSRARADESQSVLYMVLGSRHIHLAQYMLWRLLDVPLVCIDSRSCRPRRRRAAVPRSGPARPPRPPSRTGRVSEWRGSGWVTGWAGGAKCSPK